MHLEHYSQLISLLILIIIFISLSSTFLPTIFIIFLTTRSRALTLPLTTRVIVLLLLILLIHSFLLSLLSRLLQFPGFSMPNHITILILHHINIQPLRLPLL